MLDFLIGFRERHFSLAPNTALRAALLSDANSEDRPDPVAHFHPASLATSNRQLAEFNNKTVELIATACKFFMAGLVWEIGYIAANTLSAGRSNSLYNFLIFLFTGLSCSLLEILAKSLALQFNPTTHRLSSYEKTLLVMLGSLAEFASGGSWQGFFNLFSQESYAATAFATGTGCALVNLGVLTTIRGIYTMRSSASLSDRLASNLNTLQQDSLNALFMTLPANALFTLTNFSTAGNQIYTPPQDERFTTSPGTFFWVLSANGGSMVLGLMLGLAVWSLLGQAGYWLATRNPDQNPSVKKVPPLDDDLDSSNHASHPDIPTKRFSSSEDSTSGAETDRSSDDPVAVATGISDEPPGGGNPCGPLSPRSRADSIVSVATMLMDTAHSVGTIPMIIHAGGVEGLSMPVDGAGHTRISIAP